jgi:glyoxylase-like metal-dependent hydrolase (beta-lactamase superfamily II)
LPVEDGIYMLTGAGANITVQVGKDGVLLVDTGIASMSEKVLAAVRSISPRPLRYIVNTTEHADHTGGNPTVAEAGETIPFREPDYSAGPQGALDTGIASVIAHFRVLERMSAPVGKTPPTPEAGWPLNSYSGDQKRIYFNGEPIIMILKPANTDGNSIVHFRRSDVISVGDILDFSGYAMIDIDAGGSINALVETLNDLIMLTVPAANSAGGTKVIPGHGRVADHAEVAQARDMYTIIRDRIQDGIKKGLTLDQIKAARPTRDFDKRYGRETGAWTTTMFVEAAYRSLTKK